MRYKSYWLMMINTYASEAAYWQNTLANIFFSSLYIFFRAVIWMALYQSVNYASVAGRTLPEMITYAVVVSIVSGLTRSEDVAKDLEDRMKTGDIGGDFLRPVSPRLMLVSRELGGKLYWLIYTAVPTLVIALLVLGGISLPHSLLDAALFLLSVMGGYLISVMFQMLMACFAFWFVNVNTLNWFVDFFMLAMSGTIVPLWFLPQWLQNIAMLLPFQAIIYIPMQLYMGTLEPAEAIQALGIQALWIAAIGALHQFLWRKGVRRIVVLGG